MSAIEKALRQIDEQRGVTGPFAGMSIPANHTLQMSSPRSGPRWGSLLLTVAAAALAWWHISGYWQPLTRAEPAPPTRSDVSQAPAPAVVPPTPPSAALPFAAGGEQDTVPVSDTGFTRPPWLDQAGQAWAGGLRNEAALLWMTGLRSESPATLALQVAQQQPLEQAEALYRRWSDRLPVLMLRNGGLESSLWTVLVLPAPEDVERAQAELKQVHGAAVQWGSVAHWISAVASGRTSPAADTRGPAVAVATATTPAPAATSNPAPAPAPAPASPARAAKAVGTDARPSAPSSDAVLKAAMSPSRPAEPGPVTTSAAAPQVASGPSQAAPSTPETSRVPQGPVEAPELSRSVATAAGDARAAPPAARAIDVDFDTVEQRLAKGQHEQALEGVLRLERTIGVNWRTRYLAGVALSSLGRWDEALAALGSAQAKNPGHARVPLYLSVAQQERGDHAAAIATLAKALESHPAMPELWLNQGHSLQAMGRGDEAQIAYWRFMDLSTQRADLQTQRAWVQRRTIKVN
jgi:tetratricopeptide (TPR) repeat protein